MSADRGNIDYLVAKVNGIQQMLQQQPARSGQVSTQRLEAVSAKVSEMLMDANDDRLDSFRGLLSSINGLLSSVESGLADLVESAEKGVEAMTSLRMPDVTVTSPTIAPVFNVPPAEVPKLPPMLLAPESVQALAAALREIQVTVEAVMPQGAAPTTVFNAPRIASWELRIKGLYGGPDKVMTITPNYLKD